MTRKPGLEALARMEYPGRFIILGETLREKPFIVYGITGRSPSSQARKMVKEKNSVCVVPTDKNLVKKGNPDLLIYNSIEFPSMIPSFIAVSNGKQTNAIMGKYFGECSGDVPAYVFREALKEWNHEPDEPNFTPRISGYIGESNASRYEGALNIIKRVENGSSIRHFFEVPLIEGKGKLISTYSGKNADPLPSFVGEPLDVAIISTSAEGIANEVWNILNPDYRVSVASIILKGEVSVCGHIINRHDKK